MAGGRALKKAFKAFRRPDHDMPGRSSPGMLKGCPWTRGIQLLFTDRREPFALGPEIAVSRNGDETHVRFAVARCSSAKAADDRHRAANFLLPLMVEYLTFSHSTAQLPTRA